MTRKSIGMAVAIVALGLALGIWGAGAFAARPGAEPGGQAQVQPNPLVRTAERADVSPPLRDIVPIPPAFNMSIPNPENPEVLRRANPNPGGDGVVQKILGPLVMPTPSASFEGMYNYWGGFPP